MSCSFLHNHALELSLEKSISRVNTYWRGSRLCRSRRRMHGGRWPTAWKQRCGPREMRRDEEPWRDVRVEWSGVGCDGRECDVRVVSLNGLGKNEGQDGGARASEHSLLTICTCAVHATPNVSCEVTLAQTRSFSEPIQSRPAFSGFSFRHPHPSS